MSKNQKKNRVKIKKLDFATLSLPLLLTDFLTVGEPSIKRVNGMTYEVNGKKNRVKIKKLLDFATLSLPLLLTDFLTVGEPSIKRVNGMTNGVNGKINRVKILKLLDFTLTVAAGRILHSGRVVYKSC